MTTIKLNKETVLESSSNPQNSIAVVHLLAQIVYFAKVTQQTPPSRALTLVWPIVERLASTRTCTTATSGRHMTCIRWTQPTLRRSWMLSITWSVFIYMLRLEPNLHQECHSLVPSSSLMIVRYLCLMLLLYPFSSSCICASTSITTLSWIGHYPTRPH